MLLSVGWVLSLRSGREHNPLFQSRLASAFIRVPRSQLAASDAYRMRLGACHMSGLGPRLAFDPLEFLT